MADTQVISRQGSAPKGLGSRGTQATRPRMAQPILSYEDRGWIQGEGWLFRGLNLYIGARDRLALIGRNGVGKTTLLKCLAGLIETDEGKRTIVPGTNVVLLEQDPKM